MERFRKILVGIDLSPETSAVTGGSQRALIRAIELARRTGANLTLFHSTWFDLYEDGYEMRQGPTAEGRQALDSALAEVRDAGLEGELVYGRDRPWIELVRRVLAKKNDLVVTGRRNNPVGRGLGSVAHKLLRKCPAPVWIIAGEESGPFRVVLAATDLTPVGNMVVELASSLAASDGADFHVLHAWQLPFEVQLEPYGGDEHLRHIAEVQAAAVAKVEASLPARGDVPAQVHVGRDAPSRAILEGVRRLEVDLLVMGTVSRQGVAGLLVGNTAEKILDEVSCSLLAIKPEGFVSPVPAD